MVRVRVYYPDGEYRGGLLTVEHYSRDKHRAWDAPPHPDYVEVLVHDEGDRWYLFQLSKTPEYDRPEDDIDAFDAASKAIRYADEDALEWFRELRMRAPEDLLERMRAKDSICSIGDRGDDQVVLDEAQATTGGWDDLREDDCLFLAEITESVRRAPRWFHAGGELIDSLCMVRGIRREHARTIRFLRGPYGGRLDPDQRALLREFKWSRKNGVIPDHASQRYMHGFGFLGLKAQSPLDDATSKALCVQAWLLWDSEAHMIKPYLCELQRLPWSADVSDREGLLTSRSYFAHALVGPDFVRRIRRAKAFLQNMGAWPPPPEDRPQLGGDEGTCAQEACINEFRRLGDAWQLKYEGVTTTVRHSIGMEHISSILQADGREVPLPELIGHEEASNLTSGDEAIDAEGLAKAKARIRELQADKADALKSQNQLIADECDEEIHELLEYLRKSTNLRGEPRVLGSATAKARSRVGQAIIRAIRSIRANHEELANHLNSSIRDKSGMAPSYRPKSPTSWILM